MTEPWITDDLFVCDTLFGLSLVEDQLTVRTLGGSYTADVAGITTLRGFALVLCELLEKIE